MALIEIVDYQQKWSSEFANVAKELKYILAPQSVEIDHIGSTSVTGMPAKDIIDIQVTVTNLADETIEKNLSAAGYVFRHDITSDNLVGVENHSFELKKKYFREKEGGRRIHIHVRELGRVNQMYALVFRDFLRSNAVVCDAYAQIKKALATKFPDNEDAYYEIKDPYMDTIYEAAKLWLEQQQKI